MKRLHKYFLFLKYEKNFSFLKLKNYLKHDLISTFKFNIINDLPIHYTKI